jgi:tagatose-1,6-bisphosphate aldolase
MPVFVQMLSFRAHVSFDDKKDTRTINEAMRKLQENGAKILDVRVSVGQPGMAVYLITYEAAAELDIGK